MSVAHPTARSPAAPALARAAMLGALALAASGCAAPRLAMHPVSYEVDVRLDPEAGTLEGRTTLELAGFDGDAPPRKSAVVELLLHPALEVDVVQVDRATLRSVARRRPRGDGEAGEVDPARHVLRVDDPAEGMRVTLAYRGRLRQDVAAGEREGEIHNFAVSAHVAPEGIYLEPAGHWYPRVRRPDDADPATGLADYSLTADPVPGFELVVGLERAGDTAAGRPHWESPFPLDGLVLLGGPLERASRPHGDVMLHAVLAPGKDAVAGDILDASAEYLERYEPLIGPYPFAEFTVLEAFFSSGFAFPGCTQIAGSQLSAFKQYRRHGYLDHELLHNWWGNGVLVDPRDGNWCEGLASYLGNYYGHVLDGDPGGARKQRRNQSNFLSSLEPADDLPLGTFGLEDGAGRGIGYMKGAAVFHMLERRLGAEALFAGLRLLAAEKMGRHAGWDDLRDAMERASGRTLGPFFERWVRGAGAPELRLVSAEHRPDSGTLVVTVAEHSEGEFAVSVPLRLYWDDRTEDVEVTVSGAQSRIELPVDSPPGAVELDPDYHVFRRLGREEAMPTSALTRGGRRLVIITPAGEPGAGYQQVVDRFTRAVAGDPDDPRPDHEVEVVKAAEVRDEDLHDAGVLIVGDAVLQPVVRRLLERTRSPVRWTAGGFELDGEAYHGPGHAVFLTVHHPDLPGAGVTVYHGNSERALANARVLDFYPNSLLVFHTPPEGEEPEGLPPGMPPSEVVRRLDFEFHDRIELDRAGSP